MKDSMLFRNWKEKVVYGENGPKHQVLSESDRVKVLIGGLRAGMRIPDHPEGESVYYFLEGSGTMTVDGERFDVGPGAVVLVPAGGKRGIEAETQLAFLAMRVA
jgi:mannose-6-phosphate isomerase-like protein (cupin superfamily)